MSEIITGVWVNKAGSGETLLKDGTGEIEYGEISVQGTVVGDGPQRGETHVLGSNGKAPYKDIVCTRVDDYYHFKI
ncbi:MAG TPA: hypothetical protein VJ914_39395 [Pseudonocardiaceae bacterium]|nr:hypothetical protein [Pseudonocardiaceae bacterium]